MASKISEMALPVQVAYWSIVNSIRNSDPIDRITNQLANDNMFLLGDIVEGKPRQPLRSGAEEYPAAIVVSLAPFLLASESGDMVWSVRTPDSVKLVDDDTLEYMTSNMEEGWREKMIETIMIHRGEDLFGTGRRYG